MQRGRFTSLILCRYMLFQLPEFILIIAALIIAGHWITIPNWFCWGFLSILILKDVAIFPFVWRAYDTRDAKRIHHLIGKKGVVVEPLQPQGVVRVHGELWKAETEKDQPPIEKDYPIRVDDVKGFCLIVAKTDSDNGFDKENYSQR